MSVKYFACLAFVSLVISYSFCFSQSPNALGVRKVQDYFQDVESKSYYQQERIRSMKGEMNEYSERLHGLQEKFHQIFYGKSTDSSHQNPFGDRDKMAYPKRTFRQPTPIPEVESIVPRPSKYSQQKSESNQLAFTVDKAVPSGLDENEDDVYFSMRAVDEKNADSGLQSSGRISREPRLKNTVESTRLSPIFGGYLIVRPGLAIPYKNQTTHQGTYKTRHREYKPGMALSLSGGYRYKNWNFGAGLLYRKNEHDSGSYERVGNQIKPFAQGSHSKSIAGFFEVGYNHSLNSLFGLYSTLGLGYGVSVVEDFAPLLSSGMNRTRFDPFFFASVGIGATYSLTDFLELSLGYRYLHEGEVPAHGLELGLIGKF